MDWRSLPARVVPLLLAGAATAPPPHFGTPRALLPVQGEEGAVLAVPAAPRGREGQGAGVAVGDGTGVRLLGVPGPAVARTPVRGLCATASGGLFVLLEEVLLFREPGGGLRRVRAPRDAGDRPSAPRGGVSGREPGGSPAPRPLACAGELAVLLERDGILLLGPDGVRHGRVPVPGARGLRLARASAIPGGAVRIAVASEREVFEVPLEHRHGRPRLGEARLRHRAGPGARDAVVDVAPVGRDGLLVLTAGSLHELRAGRHRVRALPLRPGSRPTALAAGPAVVAVATTGGFLVSAPPGSPFRPAPGPLDRRPGLDAAVRGDELLLLGRRWLWSLSSAPPPRSPESARGSGRREAWAAPAAGDPPVHEVHRAALRHLGLRARDLDGLRRAAARRGLMPEIDLELYGGRDRRRNRERDEAFLSGARRVLRDRDVDRDLEYGARLRLSFDLRDAVLDPERIDASRELRALLAFRDDVLDEITRLYFERQRIRLELEGGAPPPDRVRLELRAAELAAGIDAWTGGWFGRIARQPPPRTLPTPVPTEGDQP